MIKTADKTRMTITHVLLLVVLISPSADNHISDV